VELIALYDAWGRPEQSAEYRRLAAEIVGRDRGRRPRGSDEQVALAPHGAAARRRGSP
jgi:hypothetical protein